MKGHLTRILRCGRFHSTLAYILLACCLLTDVLSIKSFNVHIDNASGHPQIQLLLQGSIVLSYGAITCFRESSLV